LHTAHQQLREEELMMRWLIVSLFTLGLVSPASAQERGNLQIFNDVSHAVQRYVWFTIFDSVHASIDSGVVTLTGKVTMPYKVDDIGNRVAKVDGVRAVRNQLDVLPISQFDDNLRVRIARAIYSHPSLANYGLGPNPSIRIIVERGRLTLDGVVMNDMDRQIARAVAGQFGTFDITNALKTAKEVQDQLEQL
jgi:hyperosmotically inducible protein